MALDAGDLADIISAVDEAMGARMEQVYEAIERVRGEFTATVQVLNDNDLAVIAEVQRMKQDPAAMVLAEAEASWERYVRGEAERLGLKIMVAKS